MTWRVANSLETLRAQLNAAFPHRSKVSDGSIGNAEHASRASDHNPHVRGPHGVGIVTARDFTHDPGGGLDCEELAEKLVASRDPRIKYIIWNRQICSSKMQAWKWRPYAGANAHKHHLHISVMPDAALYDDDSPWNLEALNSAAAPAVDPKVLDNTAPPTSARLNEPPPIETLKLGSRGVVVKEVQNRLRLLGYLEAKDVDSFFGPRTEKAVKNFQYAHKLRVDGLCGPSTLKMLGLIK